MKIEFTKFVKGENWVSGLVDNGEYCFECKLYDEGSKYGIQGGRVSKLNLSHGSRWLGFDNCFVNYDRGWDIKPTTNDEIEVFKEVLEFLESAPTTRF
jgi:hypothetical protein